MLDQKTKTAMHTIVKLGLELEGLDGGLAAALIECSISIAEINLISKCDATLAISDAACIRLANACDALADKLDAENPDVAGDSNG